MSSQRANERERAIAVRERAQVLQARAAELRERADRVSVALIATMRNLKGRPLGERGDSFFLRLPRLPVALGLMRHDLLHWLSRRGVARTDAADITLACSEACANAMEHPLSAEEAAVEIHGSIRGSEVEVVVRDFGSWSAATGEGDRGRGLEMIHALMDDLSIEHDENGTRVTMRRTLRRERSQPASAEIGTST